MLLKLLPLFLSSIIFFGCQETKKSSSKKSSSKKQSEVEVLKIKDVSELESALNNLQVDYDSWADLIEQTKELHDLYGDFEDRESNKEFDYTRAIELKEYRSVLASEISFASLMIYAVHNLIHTRECL